MSRRLDWSRAKQATYDPGTVTIVPDWDYDAREPEGRKRETLTPQQRLALYARSDAIRLQQIAKKKEELAAGTWLEPKPKKKAKGKAAGRGKLRLNDAPKSK